jgi:hypothetical protein
MIYFLSIFWLAGVVMTYSEMRSRDDAAVGRFAKIAEFVSALLWPISAMVLFLSSLAN